MPRKFTELISQEDLANKIWNKWKKIDPTIDDYIDDNPDNSLINIIEQEACEVFWQDFPPIYQDISKVAFDFENCMAEKEERLDGFHSVLGFNTLANGLSFLGIIAGGDWEWPVFFIVYWDGKKLRAYIPVEGNAWNTTTKQAYGNDLEADYENIKKRFRGKMKGITKNKFESMQSFDFVDVDKVVEDINRRIIRND